LKTEPGQWNKHVGNKRQSDEESITGTIKEAQENRKKRPRKATHYSSDDDSYTEEGFVADHQFLCSPSTRRLAEQMGRQLSSTLLQTRFSPKKEEQQSERTLCSPQERSLVRKMGSNYSPQLISKKMRQNSVSNEITNIMIEP
jgi:hypothetical protein